LRDFNGAFLRVQLNVEPPKVVEGFFQVRNEVVALFRLYDDVVDIDLLVAPYLPFEAELHAPLVYSPRVFSLNDIFTKQKQPKRMMNVVAGYLPRGGVSGHNLSKS
jgi:hypothetical protein